MSTDQRHAGQPTPSRRRSQDASGGRGRSVVGLTATVVAAFVLSILVTPQPPSVDLPDIEALVDVANRTRSDWGSARPAYRPEPDEPFSTAAPPQALRTPQIVSKTVRWNDTEVPYLLAEGALPYRYHIDRRLAERFGVEQIVDAVAQWDDIAGSRWATEFLSVVDHPDTRHRADGHPVVYLRHGCPLGYLGGAFWNHDPARAKLDLRYGTAALYGSQVDIGVCDNIRSPHRLRGVIAHEVGHTMGLAHLCEPTEVCWQAEEEHREDRTACRVMYYLFGPCREGVTEADRDTARHLYPTLPRLYGPTPAETAARASYATTWTHSAPDVVLVHSDEPPALLLAAAGLSGAVGGPLLLAEPVGEGCLAGTAAAELARVAASPARVHLVGAWPEACDELLSDWRLRVNRPLGDHDPGDAAALAAVAAQLVAERLADEDEPVTHATIVPLNAAGVPPADAAAAVAAIAGGVPMLLSDRSALTTPAVEWLATHLGVDRAYVMGHLEGADPAVRQELLALGIEPVRLAGRDAVDRSALVSRRHAPPQPSAGVVIAPRGSWTDTAVGASVAARLGAAFLPTSDTVDPAVEGWLRANRPRGGFIVGDPDTVAYPVQWAYTTHVLPADDPLPSRATRGGWWTALPFVE